MFPHDDPSIIWVAPPGGSRGRGSYAEPYSNVSLAIEQAQPGTTVVLMAGQYPGDVAVRNSGTISHPLRIAANAPGTVEIFKGCWYLYDVTDVILAGLVFTNSPNGALSAVGACERNSFDSLQFVNCGVSETGGCALFFGGSGARCNVVENCTFRAAGAGGDSDGEDTRHSVAILITEGDVENHETLNRDCVIRRNTFAGYDCGILVGSRGVVSRAHGHIVEYNHFRNCAVDGVRVKCGDTIVRGNVFESCRGSAVSLSMGEGSTVSHNRVEHCTTGIRVLDAGHTLRNNCIVSSAAQAVLVAGRCDAGAVPARNTIIEQNTFVHGVVSATLPAPVGVRAERGTSCVVRRNLFTGPGRAWELACGTDDAGSASGSRTKTTCFAEDNIVSDGCRAADGCREQDVPFNNPATFDYGNESGYGAQGWVVRGSSIDEMAGDDECRKSVELSFPQHDEGAAEKLIRQIDRNELRTRSFFFDGGDSEEPLDESFFSQE